MNFLQIAGNDIKCIFKNRIIRVSIIAIIIVPLLYSLLYLDAFWDPYARVEQLPIAVVNLDKGAKLDGEDKNYGNDLIENLKKNHQVGWKFVSESEANSGLDGKKYYAKLQIPEDFSANVTAAKTGTPKVSNLQFVSNDKKNFLAAQINGKVEVILKSEIVKNISENYVKVTFDNLYKAKDGMIKAADGSGQLYDGLNTLNGKIPELADGASQLTDGASQLYDGQIKLNNGIVKVDDGLNKLNKKMPELTDGTTKLYNGQITLNDAIKAVGSGVVKLSGSMPTLADGVNKLSDGSSQLYAGQIALNKGLFLADDGLNRLNKKMPELTDGTTQLYNGQIALNNGLKFATTQLKSGANDLNVGASQLKDGMGALKSKLPTLAEGVGQLNDGASKLDAGSHGLYAAFSSQSEDLVNHPEKIGLYQAISLLKQGADSANSKLQSPETKKNTALLYKGSDALASGISKTKDGVHELINGVQSTSDVMKSIGQELAVASAATTVDEKNAQINKALAQLQALQKANADNNTDAKIAALSSGVDTLNEQGQTYTNGVKTLIGSVSDLSTGIGTMSSSLDSLEAKLNENNKDSFGAGLKALAQGTSDLKTGVVTMQSKLPELNGGVQKLVDGSAKLNKGTSDLYASATGLADDSGGLLAGSKKLVDGQTRLYQGIVKSNTKEPTLKEAIPQLAVGANQLLAGSNKLVKGQTQLYGGLNQFNSSVPTLKDGVSLLSDALSRIADGSDALVAGQTRLYQGIVKSNTTEPTLKEAVPQLADGANQLLDGSNQLVDGQTKEKNGMDKLNSSVPTLKDGVKKLYDGSKELSTKLDDGAKQLKDGLVNSSDKMGTFVSDPVNLAANPINSIPNYGTGFAPYFIQLSLWIGAIMMFFIISPHVQVDEKTSKFNKVMGKFLSYGFVGILQALLVSVVVLSLGLHPTNTALYIALIVFLSLVFISIIQCLITLFGDAGRVLGIILLIVQLTSCAGTFPLELVPKMFKVLNPFMPFTYGMDALREAISATTINYSIVGKDVAILGLVFVIFLTISIVFKNAGEKLQEIIEGRKSEINI
ncbi:YhgE/Pip domain-containing protein [Inconstantimicrobium mannanitabidum]|uniref:Phage infection protein n=1 Tax=Inconstantimicrobium mannanitabidum TaxID=1604901 RepID=A0ACB5RDX5_9CLOT|nr:YhgE/Pip domain-containing protein [Clostridium sp. TW13]GKX66964.1 phage infection protein [Clostridium sp. TW13]